MPDAAPQTQPPVLSVITISWNQQDDIEEYLAAMAEARDATRCTVETILVDNGSVDGTLEMVKRDYPWVKLIENGANLGFAVGCNVGLEAATGDYLLLLNPDAVPNAEAFDGMLDYLREHDDVGAVGAMLLHGDGLPQQSAFAEMSARSYISNHSMFYPLREKLRKVLYRSGIHRKTDPYECGWLQGSCTMVPRHVFSSVGGLEASYFIYCEDADWCQRIRLAGFKVVHMPNLTLIHRQMGSVKRRPEYFFRRVYRSIVHYANRQLEGSRHSALMRAMLWDMRLRLPVYWLRGVLKPSRRDATNERRKSVRQLIDIIRARNPDLYDDPPPR